MVEKARFRVEYPNGYVEVIVGECFGASDKAKIKKLLRLAKRHCAEEQRLKLRDDILAEHQLCVTALDRLHELRLEQQNLLSDFFGGITWRQPDAITGAERAIMRRRDKLMWSSGQLHDARWFG